MFVFVRRNTERLTLCSGWLSVGSRGEESGEDTASKVPVCTFLYSFHFWIIHVCSKINQTKAEKKSPLIFSGRYSPFWLKDQSWASWSGWGIWQISKGMARSFRLDIHSALLLVAQGYAVACSQGQSSFSPWGLLVTHPCLVSWAWVPAIESCLLFYPELGALPCCCTMAV